MTDVNPGKRLRGPIATIIQARMHFLIRHERKHRHAYSLFAPAKTSKAVIDKLNASLKQIGSSKKLADKVAENGMELRISTPTELRELIVKERKKYAGIVKKTGAKVE